MIYKKGLKGLKRLKRLKELDGQKTTRILILSLFSLVLFSGCYSFKQGSIPTELESYHVGQFKLMALNGPATLPYTFAESLKDKIARESRLKYTDEESDIEFNGAIQSYLVTSVAPQPGERTSFNRLTIAVAVEYTNNLNPKDQWKKTFSHFADFEAEQNLLQVQDGLIEIIFNQILEDIFNQSFNNW